jgi:hypothetical protein
MSIPLIAVKYAPFVVLWVIVEVTILNVLVETGSTAT